MIRINATLFLFIVEFMILFLGVAVIMFFQWRKQRGMSAVTGSKDDNSSGGNGISSEELAKWQQKCTEYQEKFEKTKGINAQLQELIREIVPEAEMSEQYKKVIAEFEKNNKEIDMCINTLEKENQGLDERAYLADNKVEGIQRKMKDMVSGADYNMLAAEKKRLEIKVERLKDELESKIQEYAKLDKNYLWLEKEYNSLYENMEEEKNAQ
jgi:chromosome segregation ATPase